MANSQFLTGHGHSPDLDSDSILHDIDLVPPSPTGGTYDALSDFDLQPDFDQLSDIYSPRLPSDFPQTPSYHGSPYSAHSDLSDDISNPVFGADTYPEYNPSDFDNASPQYMLFGNSVYGDYSSPSSNGGSPHIAPARLSPSPRLDVQQSFENMSFNHRSPAWATDALPTDARPSPPRLMMPDEEDEQYGPPVIHAPDGDGTSGLHLNVVPATPVSGGLSNTGGAGYNLSQAQRNPRQTWNHATASSSGSSMRPRLPPSNPPLEPYQFPRPPSSTSLYIPPSGNRTRSRSESSPVHPTWDTLGLGGGGLGLSSVSSSFKDESALSVQSYSFNNDDYLSPGDANILRRSRSDGGGGRPGHVRASRSDDLGTGSYLMPPHQNDFGEFLTPQSININLGSGALMGMEGGMGRGRHVRRASSGSRSERGISSHDASPANSTRASPYPSPNVSPRGRYEELPPQQVNQGIPVLVSKQNVTTGRTKAASHNRRKQEATFVCPVPGCGSTFTRSFNLKGHMRSHNEEKPFLCPWPGCGKGFARQHDCKRHEQLHSNYRPFSCEGCQKQFARMDALNRHLKSEGGADCASLLVSQGQTLPLPPPQMETMPKPEEWDSGLQL